MLLPGVAETFDLNEPWLSTDPSAYSLLFAGTASTASFLHVPFSVLFLQLPPGGESICLSFIRPPSSACQPVPSTYLGRFLPLTYC